MVVLSPLRVVGVITCAVTVLCLDIVSFDAGMFVDSRDIIIISVSSVSIFFSFYDWPDFSLTL